MKLDFFAWSRVDLQRKGKSLFLRKIATKERCKIHLDIKTCFPRAQGTSFPVGRLASPRKILDLVSGGATYCMQDTKDLLTKKSGKVF